MAAPDPLRGLVARLEHAAQRLVWETPLQKSIGLHGLYEAAGDPTRPGGVAFHGLGLGRTARGLVVDVFAQYDPDRAKAAARSIASLMDVSPLDVRLVPCRGFEAQVAAGGGGGHNRLIAAGGFGTVGGFAVDITADLLLAVSNNHVFAQLNNASAGDALVDAATKTSFGELHRFHPLAPHPNVNILDGAVGRLFAQVPLKTRSGMKISGTSAPRVGMRVQKFGAKTGHSWGRIRTAGVAPTIGYGGGVSLNFRQCLRIDGEGSKPFSLPGDSGSLVLDEQQAVVGLLFAGEPTGAFSLANPVEIVISLLGITF